MVKLRTAHTKLKIVLFSVLGALVAGGGVAAIVTLTGSTTAPNEPSVTVNTKTEVPDGLTPETAMGDSKEEANTLYYLAYTLDAQDAYSVYAVNSSSSMGIKSTTRTSKDYSDGVMVTTDITSGITKSAVQTCYVTDDDGTLVAYKRTGSGASASATASTISWNETYSDTYYYYREDYLKIYGEFSTEMTVYLVNSDTIESCSEITDNGDGTYSQTFVFNDKAGWWYQYAMKTNGGLDDYPEFDSIEMTVTFDGDWRVTEIVVEETTVVQMVGTFTTKATTTTTFSYGEDAIDSENFGYYASYFTAAIPNATAGGSSAITGSETSALTVLQAAFSDALGENGDQFAVTLNMGDRTYYGYIYLKIDISASDILSNLDIRLTLSADENCDSQDLYVEFKDGAVNAYYSSNFALTADIDRVSEVISQFSDWANAYSYGTTGTTAQAASAKVKTASSDSFDLGDILGAIQMTDNNDGTASITLALDDLFGISAYAQIDVTVTETTKSGGSTSKTYAFKSAYIGDLSYNGEDIDLDLSLAPTDVADISHDEAETPFDLAQAISSVYALVNSTSIQVDLSLDGDKLVSLVNGLMETEYDDYIALLKDYDITASAIVNIKGVTTQANVAIAKDGATLIDLSVYYAYDGTNKYGVAYLYISKIMGEDCNVKAYCNISDLVDGINGVIDIAEQITGTSSDDGGSNTEGGTESGGSSLISSLGSLSLGTIVNAVLGLDFGNCIDVSAKSGSISVTLNGDNAVNGIIASVIGSNLIKYSGIGEIALAYTYSTDESGNALAGNLKLDANAAGIGLEISGSGTAVTVPADADAYLDLTGAIDSVYELLDSDMVELTLTAKGSAIADIVNGLTGGDYNKTLSVLNDYDIAIYALADLDGAVQANVSIASKDITVIEAYIYYAYDGTSDYGTAYLAISKLMNVDCSVKVYCDIDDFVGSISYIITLAEGDTGVTVSEDNGGSSSSTADIIKAVLALDYSKIIDSIVIDSANGIKASVNVDDIIALFLTDVTLSLGEIALDYTYGTGEGGSVLPGELTLALDGVSAVLKASESSITEPSGNYLSLNRLMTNVENAAKVALDIAENGASFELSGTVNINDASVSLDGEGEVVLSTTTSANAEGKEVTTTSLKSLALDVTLSANNGIYGSSYNYIAVQVVYLADNFEAGATDPFLYVVINGQGIKVTYDEYNDFASGINSVYELISGLIGTEEEQQEEDDGTSVTITDGDILSILQMVTGMFANNGLLSDLSKVSQTLNSYAITADGGNIALTYTSGEEGSEVTLNIVKITTSDGTIGMVADINADNVEDLSASISAYDGTTNFAGSLMTKISGYELTNNLNGMIYIIYGYVFDCVDSADITSVFGSEAYELAFVLDGDASGITALAGVYVSAEATVGSINSKNIYTVSADVDVSGFTLDISMVYYDGYIYAAINDIAGTQFTDLAVKASADDIYSLVKSVVELILNEEVLDTVSALISSDDSDDSDGNAAAAAALVSENVTEETKSTLTSVIEMLTAMLDGTILTVNTEDGNLAVINIDKLLSPFGITANAGYLTIDKTYTNETVTGIYAHMETEDTEWLTLKAGAANSGKYTSVDTLLTAAGSTATTFYAGSYVDIGFISQLVADVAKFATDGIQTDGNEKVTGVAYTFTGSISAPISVDIVITTISGTLKINNVELTIGYTTDGEFYFKMYGEITALTVTSANYELSKANNIGISYSGETGFITLARGLDSEGAATDSTIYWIMTLDYFIDNLFTSHSGNADSPLRWLLQMSDTVWNTLAKALSSSLSISSGLKTAEEYYLYNTASSSSAIDIFGSSSYLASFIALLSGTSYSNGDYSGLVSQLGLDDYVSNGYYGFSLGTGLLGSSFSPVYIGLTRGTYGIDHLLAYANIAGYVEAEVDLQYQGSSYSAKTADYYKAAVGTLQDGADSVNWVDGDATITKDNTDTYSYYKFGSVHIENGAIDYYDNSECLVDDYITVYLYEVNENGEYVKTEKAITLRYGSTVYLYTLANSNGFDIDPDTGSAVIYITAADYASLQSEEIDESDLATYVVLDSDAISSKEVEVKDTDGNVTSVTVYYIDVYKYVTSSTVYTVTIHNSSSGEVISTNYVLGDQTVTDLYSGYTLLGSLYSDAACSATVDTTKDVEALANEEKTLDIYGKFVQTTVTINGVVYTFYEGTSLTVTASNSENKFNGSTISAGGDGYYLITGFTDSETYSADEWLVLENMINKYKVLGIAADALKGSAITNVVVPENICYIAYEAFNDCTSLTNIVFLANTIYLNNNGGRYSYPFVGCNSTLNIYCNGYNGLGENDTAKYYYAFNITSSGTNYTYITAVTDWTYISSSSITVDTSNLTTFEYTADQVLSDVNAVLQSYGYNTALYAVNGAYFYTSSLSLESAIAEAVLAKLNAYTAEYCYYINGYDVSVTIENYSITVTVTETTKYYAVSVSNMLYNATSNTYEEWSGMAYSAYSTTADGVDITYSDGTASVVVSYVGTVVVYNDTLYVTDGGLTISANTSYNLDDDSSYSAYTVTLKWSEIKYKYPVTVYSDVAFTLGGTSVVAGNKTTIELGSDTYTLDELSVSGAKAGYYFLGWAYDNSGTLTFTSDITTSTEVTYYAIWGYSTLSDATISSGSTDTNAFEGYLLELSGYTFYGWWNYAGDTWTQVTSLSSLTVGDTLIVEAVWLSDLSVSTTVTGSSYTGALTWKTYTYSVTTTISGGVLSGAFANSATVSVYYGYSPNNGTDLLTYGHSDIVASGTYDEYVSSISTTATASTTSSKNYVHTYIRVTYTYGDTTIYTELANYVST